MCESRPCSPHRATASSHCEPSKQPNRSSASSAWLAWYQRGLILHWAGRSEEALVWLRRAEPAAESAGDRLTVAKLVMNRALAHAHVGDFEAAAADAVDAEKRCRELGELTLAAHFLHNRGWIAARAGDLAEGWRLMHDAASRPSWTAPPVVLADRAELAHAAGLLSEAADLAEEAWVAQRAVGDDHGAAATSLLRARIALDLGDREAALDFTATSAAALAAQGRLSLCGAAAGIEIAARREIVEQLGDAERAHARASHDGRDVQRARERRGAFVAIGPPRRPHRRRRDRPARGTTARKQNDCSGAPSTTGATRLDSTCITTSRPRSRTVRRSARSTTVASRRRGRSTRPGTRCERCTS